MNRASPARTATLLGNLLAVTGRLSNATKASNQARPARLVLVSKLKPASDILALHTLPSSSIDESYIQHFGENYVQELQEKAAILPRSINWHFIGGLQSNKCKILGSVPNLWCVSSVDSVKKADGLDKAREAVRKSVKAKVADAMDPPAGGVYGDDGEIPALNIKVQVNTSGEESKSGVLPEEALSLCKHIQDNCPNLKLTGLMTIGAIARSKAATGPDGENEDFVTLLRIRDQVAKGLDITPEELELSMGMSSDFEAAVKYGSNEVRVGSDIFGERPARKDAVV
jgi:uncharacterized pyridoxal phosphate-containing UPF0001 family protein